MSSNAASSNATGKRKAAGSGETAMVPPPDLGVDVLRVDLSNLRVTSSTRDERVVMSKSGLGPRAPHGKGSADALGAA